MKDTAAQAAEANRYRKVSDEMFNLFVRKNKDYGDSFHITFQEEGFAMPRIRMTDKLERIKNISRKGETSVTDESLRDTLMDLGNYCIMTVMEMDREAKESAKA